VFGDQAGGVGEGFVAAPLGKEARRRLPRLVPAAQRRPIADEGNGGEGRTPQAGEEYQVEHFGAAEAARHGLTRLQNPLEPHEIAPDEGA
jgi:hypothetical protein